MGDGLAAIDKEEGSGVVGHGSHFFDGVDGAEDVGHVGDGDEFNFIVEEVLVGVEVEGAVVENGDDFNFDVYAGFEYLPGDDVGVVFHLGEDNFVAWGEQTVF